MSETGQNPESAASDQPVTGHEAEEFSNLAGSSSAGASSAGTDASAAEVGGSAEKPDVVSASIEDLARMQNENASAGAPAAAGHELQAKLAAAEKEVLRVQADMENFRKRNRRETEDRIKYASLPLMNEIVGVVDNLQRALQTSSGETSSGETATGQAAAGLVEGVTMVAQQLQDVLAQFGCQPIEALGQPFDPNVHEAIQMQPSDQTPANHVSMEVRRGYKLHDRIIRPAQVFVSTGPGGE